MKNEELIDYEKSNIMCKRCNCKLYDSDALKVGYCASCAGQDKVARKAWEDKGLAKFCTKCGQMLHCTESVESGKCSICRLIHIEKIDHLV